MKSPKKGSSWRTLMQGSGTSIRLEGGEKEIEKMDTRAWLNRETFLRIAEGAGLKPGDPHLEALYAYVQDALPGLKVIEELDLKDVEPMSFPEIKEGNR